MFGFISKLLGGGGDAAEGALRGAETTARGIDRAQSYLEKQNIIPTQALEGLGSYYKVPGPAKTQEELIAEAKSSPLYEAILGSRQAGEKSILRNASATGGLRSGAAIGDLTDYNMQLENTALLEAFNDAREREDYQTMLHLSGLEGLANRSYTPDIANLIIGAAQTRGQGQVAAEQARQSGFQNIMDNILGIGKLGLSAYSAGLFSDLRLKQNITYQGERHGHHWYSWEWIPEAEALGLTGTDEGVLAHQVYEECPEAVGLREGFLVIDYQQLGICDG